jgi:hypothetical protein
MGEFELVDERLRKAIMPEEIFGNLPSDPGEAGIALKKIFGALAKTVHPDRNNGVGNGTFALLADWREKAQAKIKSGTYGKLVKPADIPKEVIKTRKGAYRLVKKSYEGEFSTLFEAKGGAGLKPYEKLFIKIVRDVSDNDLLKNEADALKTLLKKDTDGSNFYRFYLPRLKDSFTVNTRGKKGLAALAVAFPFPLYSLEEMKAAYPEGVDPRTLAWIANRLMEILGCVHARELIHSALLPCHILVSPDNHGLVLTGWGASVKKSGKARLINLDFESFYPDEVKTKRPLSAPTDIYMAVKCLAYIADKDPQNAEVAKFFAPCLRKDPASRPEDAWKLRDELEILWKRLFGKRSFHKFTMPR